MEKYSIAIIDGDEGLSSILSRTWGERGMDVMVTKEGKNAVQLLSYKPPSLIVLSVELPDTNGYLVMKQIKSEEKLKGVPIILVSSAAKASDFESHKKLKVRANEYMLKPFGLKDITSKVESLLGIKLEKKAAAGTEHATKAPVKSSAEDKAKIDALNSELESLKKENEDLKLETARLGSLIEKKEKEAENNAKSMNAQINELRADVIKRSRREDELTKRAAELEEKVTELEEKATEADKVKSQLDEKERALDEIKLLVEGRDSALEAKTQEIEEAKTATANERLGREAAIGEINRLREEYMELLKSKEESSGLKQEKSRLVEELEAANQNVRKLDVEINTLKSEVERLLSDAKQLMEESITKAAEERKNLESEINSLKAELAGAQGSAEAGSLEEDLKKKDQLIRELGSRIIEAKETSVAEREGLLSRVHELEKDRVGLHDKILDLDREKQEFKERIRDMEDNLNEAAKMLYISKQLEAELEKELKHSKSEDDSSGQAGQAQTERPGEGHVQTVDSPQESAPGGQDVEKSSTAIAEQETLLEGPLPEIEVAEPPPIELEVAEPPPADSPDKPGEVDN
jgi:DNA-binding response OmpR family regulator